MPLDENLPTYRFRPSSDNPLNTLLYFTHNGSEPTADYLIKRPSPSQSHNQYALGFFDVHHSTVIYAEILIKPEWSQPTLSATEVRANGGNPAAVPMTPNNFAISLYNPDQTVTIKYQSGSWSKDSWEFEIPERSFKMPSASQIDQVAPAVDLIPRVNFKWKRDSRMSRDMTCYMSGKTVGGHKNKEPDITVAMFQGGSKGGTVAIYEPNMRRVEVEDRKGLEVVLLFSAEVIRDLFLAPRSNPYNTSAFAAPPAHKQNITANQPKLQKQPTTPPAMSGALNAKPPSQNPRPDPRRTAEVEAEKRRVQALVAQEQSKSRERERRDKEEQARIKKMLEREEKEENERRRRRVEEETERLRKQYGTQTQDRHTPSPALPPRPSANHTRQSSSHIPYMSGGASGPPPAQPRRPRSVGPPAQQPTTQGRRESVGARQKLGQFLQNSPYAGPAAASVSGFFGRVVEEGGRGRAKKKRSTHF